jgi:hypothetical protein
MATFSDIRATFGLVGTGIPVKAGTSGSVQIGTSPTVTRLTDATKIVSFDAVIVGSASNLVIDISDLDNTGSTAWTAGTLQVETAPVSVTTVTTGTMVITLTSGVVAGSPLAVNVPLIAATHTTAALVAQAAVDVLNGLTAVSTYYTATRSTNNIVLTRKASSTYTVNGTSVPVIPADDATLKLEWSALLGVDALVASTSTTPGVATAGTYAPDLDGTDFEGKDILEVSNVNAILIQNNTGGQCAANLTQGATLVAYPVYVGDAFLHFGSITGPADGDITIEPGSGASSNCHITVTIAGS